MKHYFYMELLLTQFLLYTIHNIPPQYLYKIFVFPDLLERYTYILVHMGTIILSLHVL